MSRQPKMTHEMSESLVMKAAREQFASLGYHGARMSDVAECSGVNKRLVYEIVSDKENLYLAVLSDVSREFGAAVSAGMAEMDDAAFKSIADVYRMAFDLISRYHAFSRLLTWEWLCETIQGARILTEMRNFCEKIHAVALRVDKTGSTHLKEFDVALEAMILRFAMQESVAETHVAELKGIAAALFSAIEK